MLRKNGKQVGKIYEKVGFEPEMKD